MKPLENLYHAMVSARVRNPIGRSRRRLVDLGRRLITPGPLPPARLLRNVQLTSFVREYLDVGARSAEAIARAFAEAGLDPETGARVLDFGCGLGRTLRHFAASGWELHGCDVDRSSLEWTEQALPFARYELSSEEPPLPYSEGFFDALYAVSVFTHFDAAAQQRWSRELARILRSGGIAAVTTMGPRALVNFPVIANEERCRRLAEEGFILYEGGEAFSERAAFHTAAGLAEVFAPHFELESWSEGGLDGFQDLARLRRL